LISEPGALLLLDIQSEAEAARIDPTLTDLSQPPYRVVFTQGICDLVQGLERTTYKAVTLAIIAGKIIVLFHCRNLIKCRSFYTTARRAENSATPELLQLLNSYQVIAALTRLLEELLFQAKSWNKPGSFRELITSHLRQITNLVVAS
jgi:hypothetical protein